ncbi:putative acetyltransferase [Rosa sericea]
MSQIRQISTSIVCPTCENDELITHRVELSPWDLRLLKLEYIQKGLLFPKLAEKEVDQSLIQHLKVSLSRTLNILYPLAGRLSQIENEDGTTCFFINCNSAGAQFVHAAHDGVRVADILDPVYIPDGTSFWNFFNTWSHISRSGSDDTVSQSTPVFCRHFLDGLIDLPVRIPFSQIQIPETLIQQTPSSTLLQRVFHFPKEKVAQLKAKANAEMGTNNISSLQALMAHLWRATTRGRRDVKSDEETTYRIAIGLRQRLKPPLPNLYMGNALRGVSTNSTASDLLQHGLGWAALKINKAIASMTPEDVTRELEDWVKAPIIRPSLRAQTRVPNLKAQTRVHSLLTGSSPRFNVYGNDFGWGRPLAVRSGNANKMNGKLTVFPGAEEGSIDFEVCLLPETLHAMADDAEFTEAVLT